MKLILSPFSGISLRSVDFRWRRRPTPEMGQRHRRWHLLPVVAIDGWFSNRRHCYPPSMATLQQTGLLSERYFRHQMRGLWAPPASATSSISFCLGVALENDKHIFGKGTFHIVRNSHNVNVAAGCLVTVWDIWGEEVSWGARGKSIWSRLRVWQGSTRWRLWNV